MANESEKEPPIGRLRNALLAREKARQAIAAADLAALRARKLQGETREMIERSTDLFLRSAELLRSRKKDGEDGAAE